LIIVNLWKNIGYQSIVYMAAISGIDKSIYEAAAIDGASKVKQIFKITLPMLKPTVTILTLMSIGRIFYSDFGLFYQVPQNSGALYSTTQTIDTYVYRGLMELNNVGMSSAAGLYQSLVGFVLVLIANAIVRKFDSENALF
jgi:putative aldouronate transport system permease protein